MSVYGCNVDMYGCDVNVYGCVVGIYGCDVYVYGCDHLLSTYCVVGHPSSSSASKGLHVFIQMLLNIELQRAAHVDLSFLYAAPPFR